MFFPLDLPFCIRTLCSVPFLTMLLSVYTELIGAVEQVILEEYYEIEIEMHFKWQEPPALPELPVSEPDHHNVDPLLHFTP